MDKKSFLMFVDNFDVLSELTDEQAGQLLKAIAHYAKSGEIIEMAQVVKVVFIPIKNTMDRNAQEWEKTREERIKAGKAGGLAKASKNKQSKAKATKPNDSLANLPVSVSANVSVNDINKQEAQFSIFWNLYPEKKDRKRAFEKYKKVSKQHDKIIDGLNRYLKHHKHLTKLGEFVPAHKHPTTWLNGECWNDEYKIPGEKPKYIPSPEEIKKQQLQEEFDKNKSVYDRYFAEYFNGKFGDSWKASKIYWDKDLMREFKLAFIKKYPEEATKLKQILSEIG